MGVLQGASSCYQTTRRPSFAGCTKIFTYRKCRQAASFPARQISVAKKANFTYETIDLKANEAGNCLDEFVWLALKEHGYTELLNRKASAFANRKSIGGKQYIKQLQIGKTIYDGKRRCDFYLINHIKFPDDLIIECRWRPARWPVDEELPYLLFNILKTGIPTIVLMDGGGCRATALAWMKEQVHPKGPLIAVWTMAEFHKAVNDGLLG